MTAVQEKPFYRQWWFWLLAGVLMFALGFLIGRSLVSPYHVNPVESLLFRY